MYCYPECYYGECRYADCSYAECRGAMALPANIRLDWKRLPGTNTQVYLKNRKLWTKFFYNPGPC
jgi:hypothetical protein